MASIFKPLQIALAAGSASAAANCFHGLFSHVSVFLQDNRTQVCSDSEWAWSLYSDCFRSGFLWPALLLLAAGLLASALAVCLVSSSSVTGVDSTDFANNGGAPLACFSVGNKKTPVRCPSGPVVAIDNRMRIGIVIILLLVIQQVLFSVWQYKTRTNDDSTLLYPTALAQTSALCFVFAVVCLVVYARSNRLLYVGLFPWILPVLIGIQLITGLIEIYFCFFTIKNSTVAIFGRNASVRSKFLISTVAISFVLTILFSLAQRCIIFTRPLDNTDNTDLKSSYALPTSEGNNADDSESTPFGHSYEQKVNELVDTPEFSTSWFDRLTFSWPNDLLRKGSSRQLQHTDFYKLDKADMPVSVWRHYLRHRKPGRSLAITVALTLAPELFLQAVLSIVTRILQFAGPFFLQRIIRLIEQSSKNPSEVNIRHSYLDAFGLLLFTLSATLLSNQTNWLGHHVSARIKGLLVAELSLKTLRRRGKGSQEKKEKTESEGNDKKAQIHTPIAADGKVMNLLTSDFHTIAGAIANMDNIYSMLVALVIGIWYMYQMLGMSAFIGLTLSCAYVPLSKVLYTYLTSLTMKAKDLSDERISMITELVQGIKAVKLFGWESRFVQKIDEQRERQLEYAWRLCLYKIAIGICAALNPILILLAILTAYVFVFGNRVTAEVAFTSISVFHMVRAILVKIPGEIYWVVEGYVSLDRVNSYLDQAQVQDLERRIAPKFSNVLGFECACLEWESAEAMGSFSKADMQNLASAGIAAFNIETTDGKTSDNADQSTEKIPLSTVSAQPCAIDSTCAATTSLSCQDNLVSFSLKNIDVQFPIGGLSIVAGPTGSGKSSLLLALIGEMTLTRGRILLPTVDASTIAASNDKYKDIIELSNEGLVISDIAYVAQEAWLRNATIRENILFGEPYNKDRYEEVLRACALKPDLRILKAGDMTEIGERGVTLSGGQKQRVALARAVYSSRRILLIDDCLSAVDAHTGKHILMECLLNKTSLMQGRTCVLVTHHVAMCLPFAQLLVMMKDGQISLKGTPMELQMQGAFTKVLAEVENNKEKDTTSKKKPKEETARVGRKGKSVEVILNNNNNNNNNNSSSNDRASNEDKATKEKPAQDVNSIKSEDEYNIERIQKIVEQKGIAPNSDISVLNGILVEEEKREEGFVKLEIWQTYLSACGNKVFWLLLVLLLALWQAVLIAQDYWIRIWVNSSNGNTDRSTAYESTLSGARASDPDTENQLPSQHHSSIYWLGIYVLIGLIHVFGRAIHEAFIYCASIRAARTLHARLLRAVVHATPRFFDSTPFGRILSRFSHDMQTIDGPTIEKIMWSIGHIVAVLGAYSAISLVTPAFIFAAVAITLVYMGYTYYYLNTSRELKRLESNSMSPLLSLFGELIQGVSTIRAFGVKHYYMKEALNRISAHSRSCYMSESTNMWLALRSGLAGAAVSFSCAMFIIINLDWIDAGLAGFAFSYSLAISERMYWGIWDYAANESNMNAVERVRQYMFTEQEAAFESKPEHKPPSIWPTKGEMQIENLVAEYMPGVPVLHGISLTVKHGERIGVVGRTGAGKSTLSLALLRFVEASSGRIVLDGVDISKIGLEDLRHNVTIIPQDPVLFNGTIRFNLDPFNEYPDEVVWDSLRRTRLVREDSGQNSSSAASINNGKHGSKNVEALVVKRMSGIFSSLDAEIRENGQNLSLGQRQLVSLARALVRRSRLIIMDEATASVDFDTDDRIQRTIRGYEFANSTLFCIAHRLRTIIDYDRVLVLDKGKVAEFDTPHNLLKNNDGIFRTMCEKSGEYEHLIAAASRKDNNNNFE